MFQRSAPKPTAESGPVAVVEPGLADFTTPPSSDDDAPIVHLVTNIVGQGLRDRASDIHIEPLNDILRIRYRIDGNLVEAQRLPLTMHLSLVSRLKIMAGMNIVERRRPQDGQFSTVVDGREVDVRVATVSTVFGEKLVMRLLDKRRSMIGLGELGMPDPPEPEKQRRCTRRFSRSTTRARTSPPSRIPWNTCSPASTRCRPTSRPD